MKVQPITELRHVRSIKRLLADNPRDKLLFVMGVNSGLRVQDLLALRVADVRALKLGDRVPVREKKTGKFNVLIANKEIVATLEDYFAVVNPDDEHFLFKSRKGKNYPLTTLAVTKKVKAWTAALNLKGNYGAVTMRKSWAFLLRKEFKVSWEVLAKRLNHSSPSVTRRYMGVQDEEVEEVLMNAL
jgi:integrase